MTKRKTDLPAVIQSGPIAQIPSKEDPRDTSKAALLTRISNAETPEMAAEWLKVYEHMMRLHRAEIMQSVEVVLAFVRVVAILGIGCALIAIFHMQQAGIALIGTQVLPNSAYKRLSKFFEEASDE